MNGSPFSTSGNVGSSLTPPRRRIPPPQKTRGPGGWHPPGPRVFQLKPVIRSELLGSRSVSRRRSRRSRSAIGRSGRSGGAIGRSGGRSRSIASRSGVGGRRRRRSGCGLGAGGFLLRAGRQHQRRNECAKSKFGFHRSVPRREARVVKTIANEVIGRSASPCTDRGGKFYRVPDRFETGGPVGELAEDGFRYSRTNPGSRGEAKGSPAPHFGAHWRALHRRRLNG